MIHVRPWALLALALALVPTSAAAQASADEQARIHFQAGTEYFTVADYEAALREYTRSYELAGRPALLHNIYLCHERLGHLEQAIDFLSRYVASGEEIPRRALLEQRLANMRRRLAAREDGAEPEPETTDEVQGAPITSEEALEQPEPERVTTSVPEPERGATPEPEPAPDTPSPVAAEPPADEGRSSGGGVGVPAIASFVVAGVGLASFAVFGSLALAEDSSLEDSCGTSCTDDDVSTLRTLMNVADISLAVGVVGAVAGLVFVLTGGDEPADEDVAALQPWLGPGAGGVSGRLTF